MLKQRDSADPAAQSMERRQAAQIGSDQIVAVNHKERGIFQDALRGFDAACRAAQCVLKEVVQADTRKLTAEIIGDALWPVV